MSFGEMFTRPIKTHTESTIAFISGMTLLLLIGFWVGAYETFGGYVSRQRVFLVIVLLLGVLTPVFMKYQFNTGWLVLTAYCIFFYPVYIVGNAIGQTYYFRPSGWTHTMETFILGLEGRL